MDNEKLYFNAFNQIPQIGPVRFRKLLNFFPDLQSAWKAGSSDLSHAGLEEKIVTEILEARTRIDPESEYQKVLRSGVKIVAYSEKKYPKLLREIPNPPMVLYIRGEILETDELSVAIVGMRKCTPYGKRVVYDLVSGLVQANISVVSGLAFGIDSEVHEQVLQKQGRTLAVLACGVDAVYPASNRYLADHILKSGGAILSELPLGTPPLKHHFPNRNRIISGLSLGTVVVEAAKDSGALITARHALEQNRQVYAVPGSIYSPSSEGPNNLIKMGAKPVTAASDILEDLNLMPTQKEMIEAKIFGDNEQEQKILDLLTREPTHFDQVVKTSGLPTSLVAATLTIMEMKGKIKNLGGNQYVISR